MGFKAVKVFATSGSTELAQQVCEALKKRLPTSLQPESGLLGKVEITRFSNDNLMAKVDNVRGHFAVVIHTQVPPVNDHLIELFALLDAIENARADDLLLVFPYMPYARSDRKNQPRISTMAPRLANILVKSFGIRRVILLDPHDGHTKHFFEPAADEISAIYLMADYIKKELLREKERENCIVVFADAGAAKRFGQLAHLTALPVAYIDKDRPDDTEHPDIKKVVGNVRGKFCILIDDEILTGGTVVGDTGILLDEKAAEVAMLAVHPVLEDHKKTSLEVIRRLEESLLERIIVTNSIPIKHKLADAKKFRVLSIDGLLAEAISRTVQKDSLTILHDEDNVPLYRG